jgi:hypothetical protein
MKQEDAVEGISSFLRRESLYGRIDRFIGLAMLYAPKEEIDGRINRLKVLMEKASIDGPSSITR